MVDTGRPLLPDDRRISHILCVMSLDLRLYRHCGLKWSALDLLAGDGVDFFVPLYPPHHTRRLLQMRTVALVLFFCDRRIFSGAFRELNTELSLATHSTQDEHTQTKVGH